LKKKQVGYVKLNVVVSLAVEECDLTARVVWGLHMTMCRYRYIQ